MNVKPFGTTKPMRFFNWHHFMTRICDKINLLLSPIMCKLFAVSSEPARSMILVTPEAKTRLSSSHYMMRIM
jgi:hypothetical protein